MKSKNLIIENTPLQTKTSTSLRHEHYEFIISGAGSAGAVLAARLSENPLHKVLLIEAGPIFNPNSYPNELLNSSIVGGSPKLDWGYHATNGNIGHQVQITRGKVVGGSSALNGAVSSRGTASDFERWTSYGLEGWTYNDVLPFYKKLEQTIAGADKWHGRTGPLPVHQLTMDDVSPMQHAFIEASENIGFEHIMDFNADKQHGVGPYAMNVIDGMRINTGIAYLSEDVRRRPNLFILADTLVDKVVIKKDLATGVRLADGTVLNGKNIILSSGTYGSAATLLRSGIGPSEDLKALGIPLIKDLPVGCQLFDHPFYYNAYAADPALAGRQTPVIGAFLWTKANEENAKELDIHITATHLLDPKYSPTGVGFVLAVGLTRPTSVGRVTLPSVDPADAPIIDLNFLDTDYDKKRMLAGVKLARKIGATAPLNTFFVSEIAPGVGHEDNAALMNAIMSTLDTYHHPTSTVPMGLATDAKAVVDAVGLVHGIGNLRVIDASIFPDALSTATNLTVIMTAEKIASHMLAKT